jgi:hypothetical protein
VVSSSFGGRVSPTIAKLSVDRGPPVDVVLDALVLDDVLDELLPLHEGPHADMASVTHWLSQVLEQHHESPAQTAVAHGLHPEVSAAPVVQGECAHVPPELDVDELDVDELDVDVDAPPPVPDDMPPHTFVSGMQTWYVCPSAPAMDMHVRPVGHALVEQSGAQYWSPANCAQSQPEAQFEFWRHGGHAAAAPPRPVAFPPVPPVPCWLPLPVAHATNPRAAVVTIRRGRICLIARRLPWTRTTSCLRARQDTPPTPCCQDGTRRRPSRTNAPLSP